jgi:hypothetical protein
MNIDKSRFLLLVTTLSASSAAALAVASGCTVNNTTVDAGNGSLPDSSTEGPDLGDGSTTSDDGGDAGACLGNTKPIQSCDSEGLADGGDAGDAGAAACLYDCNRFADEFTSEVAQNMRECMDLAPTCEGTSEGCALKALARACDDPTATTYCANLLSCGTPDGGFDAGPGTSSNAQTQCVTVVRALKQSTRDALTTCVTSSGGACAPNVLSDCLRATYE